MTALILATLLAQSTTAPEPSFAGITLAQTAKALVSHMGEPVDRVARDDGTVVYAYLGPEASVEFAYLKRGYVVSVAVRAVEQHAGADTASPSALGIALGDPAGKLSQIASKRLVQSNAYAGDDGLQYSFTIGSADERVTRITADLVPALVASLPSADAAEPLLHGGTSFDDAIVLIAPSDPTGVQSEYAYLALHPCAAGGRWKIESQALAMRAKRPYDILSVACPTDNTKRSFYFDIAGYFGKL